MSDGRRRLFCGLITDYPRSDPARGPPFSLGINIQPEVRAVVLQDATIISV